ncbi:MAG: sodium-dependent transporter [Rikenellaceae bacterium]
MNKRGGFKSRFGLIAAVGGSVVGLGNIWRFPYLAGENGGAAFILVYIIICFLISVPIMISELSIGRAGQSNAVNSFRKIAPGSKWEYAGMLGVIASVVMISFYSVVAGWSLEFLKESLLNGFAQKSSVEIQEGLTSFINSGWRPVMWTVIFILATCAVVLSGIEKGIERYSKIMMPMIILILLGMFIYSFSMSGFMEGVSFLLKPDFGKITPSVILQALGQSFFSLSLGMGAMITYGSYIKKETNLGQLASTISLTDMAVAILSGLAIFPAVFSMGINPTSGPDLVFITLPGVFNQMPGGYVISIVFFFLLFMAAITSSVSMVEVITAYLKEEFKIKRHWGIFITACIALCTGTLSALSQVEGSRLKIFGMNFFDFFDNLSATYLLPIGGFLTVIFVGWFLNKDIFKKEVTSDGRYEVRAMPVLRFLIKFVSPVVILLLLFNLMGLI